MPPYRRWVQLAEVLFLLVLLTGAAISEFNEHKHGLAAFILAMALLVLLSFIARRRREQRLRQRERTRPR